MLAVDMYKDIGEYKKKVYGLTKRTLVFSAIAGLTAILVGCYCVVILGLPQLLMVFIIPICVAPIIALGWWSPLEIKLEEFMPLWWEHTFNDAKMLYISEGRVEEFYSEKPPLSKSFRKSRKRKGWEYV